MNFESWNRLAISLCKDFKALQPEKNSLQLQQQHIRPWYALFYTSLQCFCEEGATCMKLKRTVVVQGIRNLRSAGDLSLGNSLLPAHSLLHPDPSIEKYDEASWIICGPTLVHSKPVRTRESVTVGTGPPLHPPGSQNHGDNTSSCEWGRVGCPGNSLLWSRLCVLHD